MLAIALGAHLGTSMKRISMKSGIVMAALFAVSGLATAQSCGQIVESDLRLDRDLHCPDGTALLLARSGVTIDLNGHTISGDADSTAINVTALRDVRIVGPGRIQGVGTGVEGTRVLGLIVTNLEFVDVGNGVRLYNSSEAEIAWNSFDGVLGHAIAALALPYSVVPAYGNSIHDNSISNSEYGVLVSGEEGGDAVVAGNAFEAIGTFGIIDAAPYNRLENNRYGYIGVANVAR